MDHEEKKKKQQETYDGEVHDLEDPDSQSQVDQDQDHQQQDEEVKAAFPPAVDSHFVHLWFLWTLDIVPMSALFLGHLGETGGGRGGR